MRYLKSHELGVSGHLSRFGRHSHRLGALGQEDLPVGTTDTEGPLNMGLSVGPSLGELFLFGGLALLGLFIIVKAVK